MRAIVRAGAVCVGRSRVGGYNKYCTWLESCKIGIVFFRGLVFVGVCVGGGGGGGVQ